jgi:hypothetical protein
MSIDYYPYDAATAHRPSLEDLGGDAKINDATDPPDTADPQACEWNNFARLHAAFCRMMPTVSVTINFAAGAPFVETLVSMGTEIVAADLVITDNAAGDTTISWAAGVLPTMSREPTAHSHADSRIAIAWAPSALSARVTTRTDAGVLADAKVTVHIY